MPGFGGHCGQRVGQQAGVGGGQSRGMSGPRNAHNSSNASAAGVSWRTRSSETDHTVATRRSSATAPDITSNEMEWSSNSSRARPCNSCR
jgi:hypothetical protein